MTFERNNRIQRHANGLSLVSIAFDEMLATMKFVIIQRISNRANVMNDV
jgi:energy-converting hydrogenase Eha subunit E